MRRDDELRLLPLGDAAQFAIDRVLKDQMQVRIRFVQQQHGARACIQEREQHQNLLKPAPCARNVEPFRLP